MQLFIKLPEPYRTKVIDIDEKHKFSDIINIINNNTNLKKVNYYIFNGTTIFTDDLLNLTINEFNEIYPHKAIENESTFQIHIRIKQ